jgi:hypothetical protein
VASYLVVVGENWYTIQTNEVDGATRHVRSLPDRFTQYHTCGHPLHPQLNRRDLVLQSSCVLRSKPVKL